MLGSKNFFKYFIYLNVFIIMVSIRYLARTMRAKENDVISQVGPHSFGNQVYRLNSSDIEVNFSSVTFNNTMDGYSSIKNLSVVSTQNLTVGVVEISSFSGAFNNSKDMTAGNSTKLGVNDSVNKNPTPAYRITFKSIVYIIELDKESVKEYIDRYSRTCQNKAKQQTNNKEKVKFCPCVPPTLHGRIQIDTKTSPNMLELQKRNSQVELGGYWKPQDCYARDRVAIIIPFRDRQSHLNILLKYLHPFLQRQQIEYRIFVIEQVTSPVFNKASLMNAGYLEVKKLFPFDCIVFHDVDMIPEDDRNFYSCMNSPRHVAPYVDKYKYNIYYHQLIGGAMLFKPTEFEKINGYSNLFFGWGGEDDNMFKRLHFHQISTYRYPKLVARYTMIRHQRDKGNPVNQDVGTLLHMPSTKFRTDGLNSVKYLVQNITNHAQYTRISVDLRVKPWSKAVRLNKKKRN